MHLLNTGQNKDAEYLITENDFNCKKTPFEEISLQELNKCLQKFFFVGKKNRRPLPLGHCAPKL